MFLFIPTLCERTAKALARLRRCAGSPEPSLVAYVIRTTLSWAGSIIVVAIDFQGFHVMRKHVFWVCDQVRLKLACSTSETSKSLEPLDIAGKGIIVSKQWTIKALIRLRIRLICVLVVRIEHKTGFSWRGSYNGHTKFLWHFCENFCLLTLNRFTLFASQYI